MLESLLVKNNEKILNEFSKNMFNYSRITKTIIEIAKFKYKNNLRLIDLVECKHFYKIKHQNHKILMENI